MSRTQQIPYIFMSYKSRIENFVAKVCHCLKRQAKINYYYHPERKKAGDFPKHIKDELAKCDYFVLFLTEETTGSKWQMEELDHWLTSHEEISEKTLIVNLHSVLLNLDVSALRGVELERIIISDFENNPKAHLDCANQILSLLEIPSAAFDDLPTLIDAKYEKDIIKLYEGANDLPLDLITKGYPSEWPTVYDYREKNLERLTSNPLNPEIYGNYRHDKSAISVDARFGRFSEEKEIYNVMKELTFPEAGPRETILEFPDTLHVAIVVSGGIAPGINSVISAIQDRHKTYEREFRDKGNNKYHSVEIYGCIEGFNSFCEDGAKFTLLNGAELSSWSNRGGSIIPTARADQLLNDDPLIREALFLKMIEKIKSQHIDILYIIGGEGSMRAAHALWTTHHRKYPDRKLSVIGIPKTMDNDILWVWQSFGFQSAVGEATRAIIQLSTEASSNPRVGIMQLFGSSSGFVVSHAALGSNVCDLVLIPELDFNMIDVCRYMRRKLSARRKVTQTPNMIQQSPYGMIVMAETAIPNDFESYMHEDYVGLTDSEKDALITFQNKNRRLLGQTPDALRSAGLKIVSRVLQQYIQGVMGRDDKNSLGTNLNFTPQGGADSYWESFRVFTNEPRHLIRSIDPSVSDVAYGIRLGTMAVDMALAGYTDCMVSQWLTEYVVVPLKLVVLGRKQMPKEGIFWKTVISNTGQIEFDSLA